MIPGFSLAYIWILFSLTWALPKPRSINVDRITANWFRAPANTSTSLSRLVSSDAVQRDTDPYASAPNITLQTPLGQLVGKAGPSGYSRRFTIRYAQPPVGQLRFADPVAVTNWNGMLDGTALPNACPQDNFFNPSLPSTNEDCLFLTVYVPQTQVLPRPSGGATVPVLVWIHGGSYASGGIALPGLDGTKLANQGAIVVVIQYRLGMLGFLRSSKLGLQGNYGTKDVQLALKWVKNNIASFGGGTITIAGQSSGASMTPAIGDYVGDLSLSQLNCSTVACLRSKGVSDIIDAQNGVIVDAHSLNAAVSTGQVYSPVVDGTFVKMDFQKAMNGQNGGLTRKDRKGIFTNVAHEECALIEGSISPTPIPTSEFNGLVQLFMAPPQYRSDNILATGVYDPASAPAYRTNNDGTRLALNDLGTDYNFRCIAQQATINLTASKQGTFWVAQFNVGIPYPNTGSAFCDTKVAHQDDIPLVFSSGPVYASTTAQQKVAAEIPKRWISFIKSGNPNTAGSATWNPAVSSSNLNLLLVGGATASGTSEVVQTFRADTCQPNYWGSTGIPFDSQIYT
ncbi:alpha/beta-hydrolase [Atractiella rhizophila]|nr:alpha/beta-hydrolase [Atractiella rhizophila]